MAVHAFSMQLKPGAADEYRRRHEEIWPELVELLRNSGISDYSIFHDRESDALFAVLSLSADNRRDTLPDNPILRRWWEAMAPLMETNPDNSPIEWPLDRVFYMD
jgi:L-rhamnose mutarotase